MTNKTDIEKVALEDKAIELLEKGHLRRAERVLKRMLMHDPNHLPAHFHLARVYRRTKQYDLALCHGRRTLRLNPLEKNASLNLGLIYEFIGNDRRRLFIIERN
jgi:Tfp pilus assembly protein PilF